MLSLKLVKDKKIGGFSVYQKLISENRTIKKYFNILEMKKSNFIKNYYLFGVKIFSVKPYEKLLRKITKVLPKKTEVDTVYVLANASGETFFFLHALEQILKKQDVKSSVLIINNKAQEALCKMYAPDSRYYLIKKTSKLANLNKKEIIKFGYRFLVILPLEHYVKWHKDIIYNENIHYYTSFLEEFNLKPEDIPHKEACIPVKIQEQVFQKTKKINLNLDNFIFISPDAKSNPTLDITFWEYLNKILNKHGYDLFYNTYIKNITPQSIKTCKLDKQEVQALCKQSKGIIGIKSGLMEPLCTIKNIPIVSIYTPMFIRCDGMLPYTPAALHMHACSCYKCPDVQKENIFEFNAELFSQEDLLKKVINVFVNSEKH